MVRGLCARCACMCVFVLVFVYPQCLSWLLWRLASGMCLCLCLCLCLSVCACACPFVCECAHAPLATVFVCICGVLVPRDRIPLYSVGKLALLSLLLVPQSGVRLPPVMDVPPTPLVGPRARRLPLQSRCICSPSARCALQLELCRAVLVLRRWCVHMQCDAIPTHLARRCVAA
jgi:hypothetical protein